MMHDVVKQCKVCGEIINIDIDNISGIALLQTDYYHSHCLIEYANKRVKVKKHAAYWDYAIDHLVDCENNAKETLQNRYYQDELNEYLLKRYDIVDIPTNFWSTVMDLRNGKYRRRKCKPVSTKLLFNTWVWGQNNLDRINRNNKKNNRGPKNDNERLVYDLAIILKHIPDYQKAKAKHEAEEAERQEREKEKIKINYNNITSAPIKTEGLDDISDLLDEF